MEVKAREAQGRHREVRSERSVYPRCEPTNRNWIGGVEAGRVRMRARSPYPSKAKDVNPAVVHRKRRSLPRETYGVSQPDTGLKGLRGYPKSRYCANIRQSRILRHFHRGFPH